MLEPEQVADAVVATINAEEFLVLPHPEVLTYWRRKTDDYDRWLRGMRRLQAPGERPGIASRPMAVRLEPTDEYMHELGPEPNFNESMYVNIFDPGNQIGGFFRIGNRANEGYAEMTVCLYLPDGQVGFRFKRAEIENNDAFDAGGMKWEIVTPFEELNVSYRGKVVLLDDPLEMTDPKKAFTENPYSEADIDITFTGQGRASHVRRRARRAPRDAG